MKWKCHQFIYNLKLFFLIFFSLSLNSLLKIRTFQIFHGRLYGTRSHLQNLSVLGPEILLATCYFYTISTPLKVSSWSQICTFNVWINVSYILYNIHTMCMAWLLISQPNRYKYFLICSCPEYMRLYTLFLTDTFLCCRVSLAYDFY